jgi:hypothetical protein
VHGQSLDGDLLADMAFMVRIRDDAFAVNVRELFRGTRFQHGDGARWAVSKREADRLVLALRGIEDDTLDFDVADMLHPDWITPATRALASEMIAAHGWREMPVEDEVKAFVSALGTLRELERRPARETPSWFGKVEQHCGAGRGDGSLGDRLLAVARGGNIAEGDFLSLCRDTHPGHAALAILNDGSSLL